MESEAIGNTISLYENSEDILYPTIPEKMWKNMDEVKIPSNIMELEGCPCFPRPSGLLKKKPPELPIGVWQLGPFTQAGQILELDILLKGVFKEKAKVEATLDKWTVLVVVIGQALQAAGADDITLREMGTGSDLISPRTWRENIEPRTRKMAAWKSPKVLHICGATDLIIEVMADCGADAISVDIKNNLVELRNEPF